MTSKERKALSAAASHLAVANTPLFVVRKIRQDVFCKIYTESVKIDTLARNLEKSLTKEPRTLRQAVAPYLYATAIFNKGVSIESIKKCQTKYNSFPFFQDIRNFLIASFKPSRIVSYDMNMTNRVVPAVTKSQVSNASSSHDMSDQL